MTKVVPMRTHQSTKFVKASFPVLEMTCSACAISVESMLKATNGVREAGVNFATQTAWIEYDEQVATPGDLQNSVRAIGYDLVVEADDPQAVQEEAQRKHYHRLKIRTIWSSVLAAPVVVLGMFFMDEPFAPFVSLLLSVPVIFYFGKGFFVNAWKQARFGKANMDTLVALSTGIAFIFSAFNTIFPDFWHARGLHAHVYFEAAVVVMAFISLGKLLEEKAKSNTSSAIKKLMGLQPKTVRAYIDGVERDLPVSEVKKGHVIVVKPGERIPVDGEVIKGESYVDEKMISGEPVPVLKSAGDKVFAGTVNQKGAFQFEAHKVGGETILAQIIKMVQQAQGSKAPVQKLVDRISAVFVPALIAIAVLTFIVWIIAGGEHALTHALLTSVTVLVIACPCALGLATPTAIIVGVGKGAENNILIKDAESLELAHRVNAVVLDKTGTITEGKPVVTDLIWLNGNDNEKFQDALYSIEGLSEHPLAEAVVNELSRRGAKQITHEFFESITGRGVKAIIGGETFLVGNEKLISGNDVIVPEQVRRLVFRLQGEAKTVMYFVAGPAIVGLIAVADKVKATSKAAVKTLLKSGIEVYMLTGDNEETAKAVASQIGIGRFKSQVLPGEKAEFVKMLQSAGKVVAMVGDGINDSQALAQADVSIAMGKGSDIAMDVAKVTLITSDLQSIPKALKLSSRTVQGIRQNLFWAFIYNVVGIPLAAGVLFPVNGFLLDPMIAGAAMALSSVSVVANSLRLRFSEI